VLTDHESEVLNSNGIAVEKVYISLSLLMINYSSRRQGKKFIAEFYSIVHFLEWFPSHIVMELQYRN
jgi:hypothetical protein